MRICIATACLALLTVGAAQAKTYTYNFTANAPERKFNADAEASLADDVLALYGPGGSIAEMTGSITFDDTVVSIDGAITTYAPTVFQVDGLDLSALWPGLETRAGGATTDFIGTLSDITSTTPMDAVDLIMQDDDNTAFGGGVPFANLDLADFETALLLFYNPRVDPANPSTAFTGDRVDFTLTSLTLQAVPLPAGLPLLLGGLGAMAVIRRRQTKNGAR